MPYTSAQLCNRACFIAKAPGFLIQAGQYLNMILEDLCQTYDFDFIRETLTLPVSPLPANGAANLPSGYALATDHLRTREVFYYVSGEPFYLTQMPIEEYDQLYNGPGISNYPENYAVRTETDPYTIYFYQPPQIPLTMFVRYQPQMADILNPETSTSIPWFINQRYLLKKLAADLMGETDDGRAPKWQAEAEGMLEKFLIMKDDKENYAQTIKLDRRVFKGGGSLRATKQQPL